MLFPALRHLADALSAHLEIRSGTSDGVALSALVHPGTANGLVGTARDKLVVSLVRLEEDRLSMRPDPYERVSAEAVRRTEPPIVVSAFVLVAATHQTYSEALKALALAVGFFQHTRAIEYTEIDGVEGAGRVTIEMESPSFEQLNHLWGTIGTKFLPSVLYRLRVVEVDDPRPEAVQPATGVIAIEAGS